MDTTFTHNVFTVAEVAKTLRVSDETIRRKIIAGELEAIEVSSKPRKTYRIAPYALVRWLGAEKARDLFGIKNALDDMREAFLKVPEQELEDILTEAVAWARSQVPERQLTGRVLSPEEIRERFKK